MVPSPTSPGRSSPGRRSTVPNDESNRKQQRRKRLEKRRRPVPSVVPQSVTKGSSLSQSKELSHGHGTLDNPSQSSSTLSSLNFCLGDPFKMIARAVDLDENSRDGLELLQVPLETGKLYHNEKLFLQALDHLQKQSRSIRFGWSKTLSPRKLTKDTGSVIDIAKAELLPSSPSEVTESSRTRQRERSGSPRSLAITPIILSGILANLSFSIQQQRNCSNPNCCRALITNQTNSQDRGLASPTSAELVNYTVGMRRAALSRVRLRMKRERAQRITKPILAIVVIIGLYFYAWSNLQLFLVGFYGVTSMTYGAPTDPTKGPQLVREDLARLVTSSCRTRRNGEHFGFLNDYAKACRIAEARAFELLTSSHNHRHTKLFAGRISNNFVDEHNLEDAASAIGDEQDLDALGLALMEFDDTYEEDKDLTLYSLHTLLNEKESSIIPLEEILHGKHHKRGELKQRQRWKRRRRRRQKQKTRASEIESSNYETDALYESLSVAVQFWGDTMVNRLVREAIVEAHHHSATPSSMSSLLQHQTAKSGRTKSKNSGSQDIKDGLRILDVGSGLSGTLFSLINPEFPFAKWSYHGISISQPEVRRAKQLVETALAPILKAKSTVSVTSDKSENGSTFAVHDSRSFPLANVTIKQSSFDDPVPPEEHTTIIAIESLSYSRNITRTLINLSKSLTRKGSMIVVDDVVAPWATDTNGVKTEYISGMMNYTHQSSLLTHEQWLDAFEAAGLKLERPVRDLMLEFDASPNESTTSSTASSVTGLPFIGLLLGERSWYTTGHFVLSFILYWFRGSASVGDIGDKDRINDLDDDGHLSNRALRLMGDMMQNDRGNLYRKAAYNRADLGYYMYVCRKE